MAISTEIHQMLTKGQFERVEDHWLGRLGEEPENLDYFVGVARALAGNGEDQRARFLLEMLDENLHERQAWSERLALLRAAGELLFAAGELHPAILETLSRIGADNPHVEGLFEIVGLHRAVDDIPKTWDKGDRVLELLPYREGVIVEMEGKGAGQIAVVNLELKSFKVELTGQPVLTVGFRAAAKMLRLIPPEHVLARKILEPEKLRELAAHSTPVELLELVFRSYDRPLTAGEIRQALSGILPDKRWQSWWTAARKAPSLVTSGKGRQTYSWVSSEEIASTLWEAFERADLEHRLKQFRQNADRDAALRERMVDELVRVATAESTSEAETVSIWVALDRLGEAPGGADWSIERLVADSRDVNGLVSGLKDRTVRQLVFEQVAARPDSVERLTALLAIETDAKLLKKLCGPLRQQSAGAFFRFVDETLSSPRKRPAAFTWIAEEAAVDHELLTRSPLRLLQQVLSGLANDDFSSFRKRLEALFESGQTVPKLLPHLDEQQAEKAATAIERSVLPEFERTPLLNALKLRFASLSQDEDEALFATAPAIERKRAELKNLVEEEIPANRRAIETARAHGDLRENFEYHAARQRHEYLSARLEALHRELERARPIDRSKVKPDEVRIGTRVLLQGDDRDVEFTILGPWESDPENGVISYQSELGEHLLGTKKGDAVQAEGHSMTVVSISVADWDA